jgi:hypothetical protein
MNTLRKTLETDAVKRLVDLCFRKYPGGLVTNVQKGKVPSQYQSLASYVAKYVVSPPISVRRIDRYDGERVTYHYHSHRTERMEHETVDVITFTDNEAIARCSWIRMRILQPNWLCACEFSRAEPRRAAGKVVCVQQDI